VDSLTLPHAYKLVFTFEGQDSTALFQYEIKAEQVAHNQTIEPKLFVVQ